jgi:serine/threonine-protein kinase RsbW
VSAPVPDPGGYAFVRLEAGRATLRFAANRGHVPDALRDLAAHLKGRGCPSTLIDDSAIVLAEVLNNVEEHAYAGRPGQPVTVHLDAAEGALRCVVEDHGRHFPESGLPGPDMPAGNPAVPDTLPEGGFGWPLVHRLTSHVTYVRDGRTNRLVFCLPARPTVGGDPRTS